MRYILFVIVLFITSYAHADKVTFPFECYPQEIMANFAQKGMKLDPNGEYRTDGAWGFLVNRGTEYDVISYKPITDEEFKLMQSIYTR